MDLCKVENCDGKRKIMGYCTKHYQRYRKYGDPLTTKPRGRNICGTNNPRWNNGSSEYSNHYELKKKRKEILNKNPYCIICFSNAEEIHHKDCDKTNHSYLNLMPLCSKCHKTIHKGRKNNYKGRKYFGGLRLQDVAKIIGKSKTYISMHREEVKRKLIEMNIIKE